MRNVILYVNLTLDGYLAGPQGELDWMLPDAELNIELSDDLRSRVDTILIGRRTHEAFEQNFGLQATHPDSPPELADFARWMLDTPKVVFSRTRPDVGAVSTVATREPAEEVAALKAVPGKDLVLFGGVDIVQQFVREGLVDEYWVKLYPVALGAGQPMFTDLRRRADLTLTASRAYDSGILVLRYR